MHKLRQEVGKMNSVSPAVALLNNRFVGSDKQSNKGERRLAQRSGDEHGEKPS